jgi:hypothetical protein
MRPTLSRTPNERCHHDHRWTFIIYSTQPDADRALLRDILRLTNVDVGGGWLIFGLPPAELAVHPSEKTDLHEFYLMCDDVRNSWPSMRSAGISCDPVQDQGYGPPDPSHIARRWKARRLSTRHARPR